MNRKNPADIVSVAIAALDGAIDALADIRDVLTAADLTAAVDGSPDPAAATRENARRTLAALDAAWPLQAGGPLNRTPAYWVDRLNRSLGLLVAATEPDTDEDTPDAAHMYIASGLVGRCVVCQRPRAEHLHTAGDAS